MTEKLIAAVVAGFGLFKTHKTIQNKEQQKHFVTQIKNILNHIFIHKTLFWLFWNDVLPWLQEN